MNDQEKCAKSKQSDTNEWSSGSEKTKKDEFKSTKSG